MCILTQLTVYFDEPFWVGVYERKENGRLQAARIVFGAEPKDFEVYAFLLNHWHRLPFSPPVEAETAIVKKVNPKRARRQIAKALEKDHGAGTKAQQALQLQREENKLEGRRQSKKRSEEEKQRQYLLRSQKKKEKHKGK